MIEKRILQRLIKAIAGDITQWHEIILHYKDHAKYHREENNMEHALGWERGVRDSKQQLAKLVECQKALKKQLSLCNTKFPSKHGLEVKEVLAWAKEELKLDGQEMENMKNVLICRAGYYNWDVDVMKMEVGKCLGWSCL